MCHFTTDCHRSFRIQTTAMRWSLGERHVRSFKNVVTEVHVELLRVE